MTRVYLPAAPEVPERTLDALRSVARERVTGKIDALVTMLGSSISVDELAAILDGAQEAVMGYDPARATEGDSDD